MTNVQHGLIQKAKRDAEELGMELDWSIRKGDLRNWTVWRMSKTRGWVINADFVELHDAHEYLLTKLAQEDH